jgi:hypothetical protein
MKSEVIEVKVEREVLWVGTDAYPLPNIARARTVRLTPNRAWPMRENLAGINAPPDASVYVRTGGQQEYQDKLE